MTYRERREAKAARLTEWAAKRAAKAEAGYRVGEEHRGDTAFWTQPGRIVARERVWAAHERAHADQQKARDMTSRAAGIGHQLDHSIYSDDPDAIDRLRERIAALEQKRDYYKAFSASARKGLPFADFEALTGGTLNDRTRANYEAAAAAREGLPSYVLSNLSADIRRNKQRLAQLESA